MTNSLNMTLVVDSVVGSDSGRRSAATCWKKLLIWSASLCTSPSCTRCARPTSGSVDFCWSPVISVVLVLVITTSTRTTSTNTTIAKYILGAHRYISDSLIVGTTVVNIHCLVVVLIVELVLVLVIELVLVVVLVLVLLLVVLVLVLLVLVLVLVVLSLVLVLLVLVKVLLILLLLVLVLVLLLRNTYCVHIATSVIRSSWVQLWYTCNVSEVVYMAFRSGTILRKSHKSTPLYLSRFQRYAGENDLWVILPPTPLGHRKLKVCM